MCYWISVLCACILRIYIQMLFQSDIIYILQQRCVCGCVLCDVYILQTLKHFILFLHTRQRTNWCSTWHFKENIEQSYWIIMIMIIDDRQISFQISWQYYLSRYVLCTGCMCVCLFVCMSELYVLRECMCISTCLFVCLSVCIMYT